jgi:hypothetical protein
MISINILYKLGISILIIQLIKENYNNRNNFKEQIINFMYKGIYLYSKCQVIYKKYVYLYVVSLYNIFNKLKYYSQIEFYDNGILISKSKIHYSQISSYKDIIKTKQLIEPLEYNFIIYSHHEKETCKKNKKCFDKFPNTFNYEKSQIKFLSLQLLYKNQYFPIELISEKYNYYMVDNIIDKKFLFFYLYNKITDIHNINIDIDNFVYKLELIDNNVNVINLDDNDIIIINKDDYTIINNNKKEDNGFIIT